MGLGRILSGIVNHPLNRKRKVAAVSRFVGWQLASRLKSGKHIKEFAAGLKLGVARGMTGATGNIYTGLLEFEDMAFTCHLLREGDLFVDVGANVGVYSLLAGGFAKSQVIGFEPIPQTFEHFKFNVDLNELGMRIEPRNKGLGIERGELHFTADYDTVNHVVTDVENDSRSLTKVEVSTLDEELDVTPVLIKIDVEGFEKQVLDGGQRVLSHQDQQAVILELNGSGLKYGVADQEIVDLMIGLNYKPCKYDPFERKVTELEALTFHGNIVFVKDLDFVRKRVKESEPIEVLGQHV